MKKLILGFLFLNLISVSVSDLKAYDKDNYFLKNLFEYYQSERGVENIGVTLMSVALIVGITYWQMHFLHNGGQDMKIYYPGEIKTQFKDVAGLAGAKADMQDIISYLKDSKNYKIIGAAVPKGILMNGGPGNGKTLLARAVAGEVNCPFISVNGSSFIQMFVGVGATRVRELFKTAQQLAKKYGACIIFIDEVDAVGQKRSSGGFSDSEHDRTVAQLLQSMDGVDSAHNPIIVLAATNRASILDPAFVRPGRFDRKVEITKPMIKDRIELITIALQNVPHAQDIDITRIARVTGGFSGAELANLINEAAILAAADNRKIIEIKDIELAHDHVILGREIKGMDQSNEVKWKTAIHEAGHAIGWIFGNSKKYAVHKASITPRSKTLGVVHALPLSESYESTEEEMKAMIVVSLCGGLAELAFNLGKSTGLASDLVKARGLAYDMVVRYGMSDKFRYISYDEIDQNLPNDISTEIHREVKKIIDECYAVGEKLIVAHKQDIKKIAELLMDKSTVLGDEIYNKLNVKLPDIEFKLTGKSAAAV